MNCELITPILTIFNENNEFDYEGNKKLVEHLIKNDIDGILVLGSTGEFPAITLEEKKNFIKFYSEIVRNRVKLFVGTGAINDKDTIELSNYAFNYDVDGVLIIPPYYFGMSQEEGFKYYAKIAENVKGNIYI